MIKIGDKEYDLYAIFAWMGIVISTIGIAVNLLIVYMYQAPFDFWRSLFLAVILVVAVLYLKSPAFRKAVKKSSDK